MIEVIPSYDPKKKILIKKGFNAISAKDYSLAMSYFAQALILDSNDLEAKIGVIIADIALDFPKKAEIFGELYQMLLKNSSRNDRLSIQKQMLDMLHSFDDNLNQISHFVEKEENLESEQLDGILYKDFDKMCESKGFKEVFENLMFSSKIIFTTNTDFHTFIKDLMTNGYYQIALSYIEELPQISYDQDILNILQKAIKQGTISTISKDNLSKKQKKRGDK